MFVYCMPNVYLYWHDNACPPHLRFGLLRIKFNCKGLCLTTGQILHSFKSSTETFERA